MQTNGNTCADLANSWIETLLSYEPGRPIEEVARELGLGDVEGIHKLASNENMLGPSPRAVEAMRRAADRMHYYPDGGAYYLRHALAERLQVTPEQLLMVNGSNEAIVFLSHAFLGPEHGIVMSERAFIIYKLVAASFRAETVMVPMRDGFTHDLDAMLAAVRPNTRLVYISNPNNPTGTMVGAEAIDRFMEAVPEHVVVVLDEAYVELLPPEQVPDTLRYVREGRRVFVLRTFSKAYGLAGLRIGYAVGPPDGIALLNRIRQPFNANAMAQIAARAALEDGDFLARTRAMVRDGQAFFAERLQALGIPFVPSTTNFLLVQVGRGREMFDALQRRGIIVRPMDGYGLPEHVRVTVGTAQQNRDLVEALAELQAGAEPAS